MGEVISYCLSDKEHYPLHACFCHATIHFQHASNHREQEALKQLLEKRNRLEELESEGHQRSICTQVHVCSVCKQSGHNKRSCHVLRQSNSTNQLRHLMVLKNKVTCCQDSHELFLFLAIHKLSLYMYNYIAYYTHKLNFEVKIKILCSSMVD